MAAFDMYTDYLPARDKYNRHLVQYKVESAINYALRSIYSKRSLLPQLRGLFLDIETFRHALDSVEVLLYIKKKVETNLNAILGEYIPSIELSYNKDDGILNYTITFFGEGMVRVENGSVLLTAVLTYNGKKFYD